MKTLRMSAELHEKLAQAARHSGKRESQIMREGIEARCDELLALTDQERQAWLSGWESAFAQADKALEEATPEQKRENEELLRRFPDGPSRHVKEIFGEIVEKKHTRITSQFQARRAQSNGSLSSDALAATKPKRKKSSRAGSAANDSHSQRTTQRASRSAA